MPGEAWGTAGGRRMAPPVPVRITGIVVTPLSVGSFGGSIHSWANRMSAHLLNTSALPMTVPLRAILLALVVSFSHRGV